MTHINSKIHKRKIANKNTPQLYNEKKKTKMVSKKELDDLVKNQNNIDIEKAQEIEKEIYHDVMAEIKTFASQCKVGGGKIHLGATSTDIMRISSKLDKLLV